MTASYEERARAWARAYRGPTLLPGEVAQLAALLQEVAEEATDRAVGGMIAEQHEILRDTAAQWAAERDLLRAEVERLTEALAASERTSLARADMLIDEYEAELAAERERVERLRMFLYDVLDYAGWENPAYVERVRALHPGDLSEGP